MITSAEAVTGNDVHDVHDVSNEKIDLTESMPLEATNDEKEETRYIVKAVPMTSIKNEQKSLDENNLPPTPSSSSLPSPPEQPQEPLNEVIIDETVITPDLNNSSAIASSMVFFFRLKTSKLLKPTEIKLMYNVHSRALKNLHERVMNIVYGCPLTYIDLLYCFIMLTLS